MRRGRSDRSQLPVGRAGRHKQQQRHRHRDAAESPPVRTRCPAWALPHLGELVSEIGETATMAMLEGDRAVHVALGEIVPVRGRGD